MPVRRGQQEPREKWEQREFSGLGDLAELGEDPPTHVTLVSG